MRRGTVDKMEQMVGSYGPSPDGTPYSSLFPTEESPSGMVARSGTYMVKSRVTDDDKEVYAGTLSRLTPGTDDPQSLTLGLYPDFEWAFKLTKDW